MIDEPYQRWKWIVAYDGTTYEGWQSQPSGNTIQDALERALADIKGIPEGTRVHGSGRTDAGVHAEGQVCHVDTPTRLSLNADSWPRAVNVRLPRNIRIMQAESVTNDFHARFSALGKTYRYQLFTGNILSPMLAGRCWQVHKSLELSALLQAASILKGEHDFKAFAANRGPHCPAPQTTVRNIKEIKMTEHADNQIFLEFTADGFLYRMVRLLVGTMVQFATGKLPKSSLEKLVFSPGLLKTSACAPAQGLYLSSVYYSLERFLT